jgi:hypothetical protein
LGPPGLRQAPGVEETVVLAEGPDDDVIQELDVEQGGRVGDPLRDLVLVWGRIDRARGVVVTEDGGPSAEIPTRILKPAPSGICGL